MSDAELAGLGKRSTVLVEIAQGREFGSAFCVDERGFFITNCHVVEHANGSANLVLFPGEKAQAKVSAKVLRMDEELDLALLKADLPAQVSAIKLGEDDGLIETAQVIAFGFPFGKELALNAGEYPSISVNKGSITALRKKEGVLNRIQIDAVVNPGNSGGPVLSKKGELIGVVVSGIVGAGAVNFAIPVSHVGKFLSKPVVAFTPPENLTLGALGDPVEFRATVSASPLAQTAYELELVIAAKGRPDRRYPMTQKDGVYSAKVVPMPRAGNSGIQVDVVFADGEIMGSLTNQLIQVGKGSVSLKTVATIKPGIDGEVILQNGQSLKGEVKGLESVALKLGGQTVTLNLAGAREIRIGGKEEGVSLTFSVVAKNGGREVGRVDVPCDFSGNGGSGTKAEFGGAPDAGGVASADPSGERRTPGTAGLEELIEAKFHRPARSGTRTTYLNVLSTSGDYIGQGKRYQYSARDMEVTPSDGKVNIRVDGWSLDLTPGQGRIFKTGEYDDARRYPFNNAKPGLNFSGNGRGSNTLSGKFVVWEWVVQGGKVTSFAIDFVQYSEGRTTTPLVGMLRYNSSYK